MLYVAHRVIQISELVSEGAFKSLGGGDTPLNQNGKQQETMILTCLPEITMTSRGRRRC